MDRHSLSPRSEINVTPLIDVCLVLLIVFMLVTPLLIRGQAVVLPETERPQTLGESPRELLLTLTADGRLLLGQAQIARETLAAHLSAVVQERDLLIRADRSLPYREVRALMGTASAAGYRTAALATVKRHPAD